MRLILMVLVGSGFLFGHRALGEQAPAGLLKEMNDCMEVSGQTGMKITRITQDGFQVKVVGSDVPKAFAFQAAGTESAASFLSRITSGFGEALDRVAHKVRVAEVEKQFAGNEGKITTELQRYINKDDPATHVEAAQQLGEASKPLFKTCMDAGDHYLTYIKAATVNSKNRQWILAISRRAQEFKEIQDSFNENPTQWYANAVLRYGSEARRAAPPQNQGGIH